MIQYIFLALVNIFVQEVARSNETRLRHITMEKNKIEKKKDAAGFMPSTSIPHLVPSIPRCV